MPKDTQTAVTVKSNYRIQFIIQQYQSHTMSSSETNSFFIWAMLFTSISNNFRTHTLAK